MEMQDRGGDRGKIQGTPNSELVCSKTGMDGYARNYPNLSSQVCF